MDIKISKNSISTPTFGNRLKALNAFNPISYYANRYFRRSAISSQQRLEDLSPILKGKINVLQIKNGRHPAISAWDINPEKSEKYVFFLHGMAQNITNYQNLYKEIINKRFGVFAVEYRSYGINKYATISEDRLRKDVRTAFDYLVKTKNISPQNITVVGHSMGGALATYLATKYKNIKNLILISPIANLTEIGQKFQLNKTLGEGVPEFIQKATYKIKPLKWLYSLRLNSINKIKNVKAPTYIIQSKNDSVSTMHGAERLAQNAKQVKILKGFITFPFGGHKVDSQKIKAVADILE